MNYTLLPYLVAEVVVVAEGFERRGIGAQVGIVGHGIVRRQNLRYTHALRRGRGRGHIRMYGRQIEVLRDSIEYGCRSANLALKAISGDVRRGDGYTAEQRRRNCRAS